MKNTLAENMLRFGSKNLDEKAVAAIKKLAEQAPVAPVASEPTNWINYPVYLAKYKPKADRKLVSMGLPASMAVVFIKPGSNVDLDSQNKFDNKTIYGITGEKWIVSPGLTTENIIFGRLASGTVGSATPGEFYALRVNAKPAIIPTTSAETNPELSGKAIDIGNNVQPTTIVNIIKPRLDYAGFVRDAWNIITNSAAVKLDNPWIDLILPLTMTFVKSKKVTPPTPEELKMNAYTLLTKV